MAVTHALAVRNAATDAATAQIGASGRMRFRISPSTVAAPGAAAANLALAATAFGAASNGVATANTISPDTNCAGNASPVAFGSLDTSGGTVMIHFAVAAASSDVNLSNGLTINAGDQVGCSALTYSALPS